MKQAEIFYFDVDGTLLDNESNTISDKTILSLNKLKELGYKVALCTGRTYDGVLEANIQDLIEWDGYVLANGSEILDKNRKPIFRSQIDPKTIHRIQEYLGDKPILMEGPSNFLTYEAHEPILVALKHFGIKEDYDIIPYENQVVYNALVYDSLDDKILEEISSKVQIIRDQLGNYELIPIDSGKHIGIQHLNKLLNLDYHVVFGDGENDLTMLRDADFGVAMGNSVDALKDIAHYVTSDVKHDGVYNALVKFKVFEEE